MSPTTARVTGWTVAAAVAVLAVLASLIGTTDPNRALSLVIVVALGALPLTFSLVGALIVSKRPDNRLGWLFAIGGVVMAATSLAQVVSDRALAGDPDSAVGRTSGWILDMLNPLTLVLATVFLFLLFPTGHLAGRSGRQVGILAGLGIAFATAGAFLEPTLQTHAGVPAPFAPAIPAAIAWSLVAIAALLIVVSIVASIVLLLRRLRRSTGRERAQLRILAWAAAVAMLLLFPAISVPAGASDSYKNVAYLFGGLGFMLIPVSVGVAILQHQLLDIDLVIRRTVVLGILSGFITVVYAGVVVGVGALVGSSGNAVLSAVAAAVVAVAFQPARRRARRLADRLVYGKRATPYEVLHDFSERVAGAYGAENVLPRMATILGEGTGADRAQVWLKVRGDLRPMAAWPTGVRRSQPLPAPSPELPPIPDVSHVVPVRDRNELLGALSVTKSAAEPVSPTEERLISDLALQAGLVLRNARMFEELRASRARLVAAQDEERRKIERNLHDGAQQQLVALAVKARLAGTMIDRDADRSREILGEIGSGATEALESLRDLARGVFPPLLADEGLEVALRAQAAKVPVPTVVRSDGIGRFARDVEATVYFCCLEALQNVAKYADASEVTVDLSSSDGELVFQVRDDGRGFDVSAIERGAGLQNMVDRVEAVGGELELRSAPGEGTRVTGRIPDRQVA